jgi:site-specific DNA-methyltransferase (adenine-specific)
MLGDCIERMKELPDKSIDCVICDLPFGCLLGGGGNEKKKRKESDSKGIMTTCDWDIKIDLEKFWYELERLLKNDSTPIIHFGLTRFGNELINSKPRWFHYDLVWNKKQGVNFLSANKQPMRSHEMIYLFGKKAPYYKRIDVKTDKGSYKVWGGRKNIRISTQYNVERTVCEEEQGFEGMRCPLSVIDIKKPHKRGAHPTEKPEELYEWLLTRYCPEGGTILDPTAGSFNSVAVANRLGLNAIGIEKDEGFFNKALERFSQQ